VTKVTIDRTVDRFSREHNTIHSQMREQGIDPLRCHDDAHFIEKPNAVIVLGASNRSDMRWSFFSASCATTRTQNGLAVKR
jgi:hypothetical protein